MNVTVVDRSDEFPQALQDFAERRVAFALSRFESRVHAVSVIISDVNGPKGGIDKTCNVSIQLRGARDVIITDRDADVAVCISRALARASRSVARSVDRATYQKKRASKYELVH